MNYPVFVLGSLLVLAMVPVARLRHRSRQARILWLRHALHRGARLWVSLNRGLGILHLAIDDRRESTHCRPQDSPPQVEPAQQGTPLLVIANHPSLIDVLLITAAIPNLCCVLKGALHYNPLFTLLIRHLDYLPNHDAEVMLAEGSARLRNGEHLLIFPEGTRTVPTDSQIPELNFRSGAAELAVRSGAATLPITIHNNTSYLSKGHAWYRLPTEALRYRLELGPQLPACEQLSLDAKTPMRRAARRALNEKWQQHFAQRLKARCVGN